MMSVVVLLLSNYLIALVNSFGDVIHIKANDLQPETAYWDEEYQSIFLGSFVNGTIFKTNNNCNSQDQCTILPIWNNDTISSINGFRRYNDKLYICINSLNAVTAWTNGDNNYNGEEGGLLIIQLSNFEQYNDNPIILYKTFLPDFTVNSDSGIVTLKHHFCNDIQIDDNGVGYITDSFAGSIYRVNPPKDGEANTNYQIEVISYSDIWWKKTEFGVNGIGLFQDSNYLVVGISYLGQLWKLSLNNLDSNFEQNFGTVVELDNVMNLPSLDGIQVTGSDELYVVGSGARAVYEFKSNNNWANANLTYTYSSKYGGGTSVTQIGDDVYVVNAYLFQSQTTENQIEKVIFPTCSNEESGNDDGDGDDDDNSDSLFSIKYIFGVALFVILILIWIAIIVSCVIFRRRSHKQKVYNPLLED